MELIVGQAGEQAAESLSKIANEQFSQGLESISKAGDKATQSLQSLFQLSAEQKSLHELGGISGMSTAYAEGAQIFSEFIQSPEEKINRQTQQQRKKEEELNIRNLFSGIGEAVQKGVHGIPSMGGGDPINSGASLLGIAGQGAKSLQGFAGRAGMAGLAGTLGVLSASVRWL